MQYIYKIRQETNNSLITRVLKKFSGNYNEITNFRPRRFSI